MKFNETKAHSFTPFTRAYFPHRAPLTPHSMTFSPATRRTHTHGKEPRKRTFAKAAPNRMEERHPGHNLALCATDFACNVNT